MQMKLLTEQDIGAWDQFVATCEQTNFFHKSGWQKVIENAFGHKTYFVMAEDNTGVTGALPLTHVKSRLFGNGLISNAFCVSGGPAYHDTDALTGLLDYAEELANQTGAHYLELRDTRIDHPNWQVKDSLYFNFERPIEKDEDVNLKQIPRKQRAVVRKALKTESLSVTLDDTIDDFYQLYSLSVRNLGTPVFGKKYFKLLKSTFKQDCEILTVRHDGRPVSSVMSFYFKDAVLPYYTGSVVEARRLGSNDLMYWHVMRRAVERGYTIFDFGRSKVDTGPYKFKKNWGFEPRPMPQSFYLAPGQEMPNVNPTNPKYQLFISMWQRLPLPVANLVGPHIVSRIG